MVSCTGMGLGMQVHLQADARQALQDVWVHAATFLLCAATVAMGGFRLTSELDLSTVQSLSILVWV